jgi:hypothetical protein
MTRSAASKACAKSGGDPGHNDVVFNLGAGEITVLVLLGLIFVGPKKLPDLASGLADLVRARRRPAGAARRWSWSDWLLVCAALASGATALLLLFAYQR